MSRPISTFLDEIIQFLEEEILPDAYTEKHYFDNCETRVEFEEERVKIRFLSYLQTREPESRGKSIHAGRSRDQTGS
jgi:hypothetical protein